MEVERAVRGEKRAPVTRLFGSFVLLCSTGVTASADPPQSSIDQIPSARTGVEIPGNVPDRAVTSPTQIVTDAKRLRATSQVTLEGRIARSPEQLSSTGKTAQPPQPLSRPSEGRPSAVERLPDDDRCDPAEPKRPRAKCANVIENRSAEFARPDPGALSPEQRLLLEQEVREGALDARDGARRLAQTGEADESLAAMGVAAAALRPKEEVDEKTKADEDVAKAAELVGAIINQPLPPAPPQ